MIILTAIVLLVLTLLFLNVYTRHDQNVKVPILAGLQVEEANAILRSKGLHIEIIDSVYQKDAVPGAIIEQVPEANSNVKKGRAIYVSIYAKSPAEVSLPELVDYSLRQAQALWFRWVLPNWQLKKCLRNMPDWLWVLSIEEEGWGLMKKFR